MKKKILLWFFVLLFALIIFIVFPKITFATGDTSNVTVILLGNHGTATVNSSYSESSGLTWQNELVNGNKVGTDTIRYIMSGPFNYTNLKAGYNVQANSGYYIDGFYRSQSDYNSGNNLLADINIVGLDEDNLYNFNEQGYLTSAILSEMTFPNDKIYISFAQIPAPEEITVVLLGNHGTATVNSSYSESTDLTWQTDLVNGNKVGTDTIRHINIGLFNNSNLKAGYNVQANSGYYIDGFYRSQSDYENKTNSLNSNTDFTDTLFYTFDSDGNLIAATLTEMVFPSDTLYISFSKIENIVTNKDTSAEVKFEAASTIVPQNTVISVEKITTGENFNKVNTIIGDNTTGIVAYEINLTSNGVKIQPKGKIKVYLPIPNDFDISNLVVYYVNTETNVKESFDVTVETIDGVKYAVFETTHFSTYILAEKSSEEKDNTPKTGTEDFVGIVGILSLVSLSGVVLLKKKKI